MNLKFVGRGGLFAVNNREGPVQGRPTRKGMTTMTTQLNASRTSNDRHATPTRLRCRAVAIWAATALCGAVAAPAVIGVAPAFAGTWALASCSQPNGQPAPTDGWASSGVLQSNYSGAYNSCSTGGTLGANISEAWPQPSGESFTWTFTPPTGSTIAGGQLTGTMTVPYSQGGGAYFAGPTSAYDGADVIANCQWNLPCPQSVAAPGPGTVSGTWQVGAGNAGGKLYAIAACSGLSPSQGCPGGYGPPAAAGITVSRAIIQLTNTATPGGSGFTGTLLGTNVRGTQDFTFNASDPGGPGVYSVTAKLDASTVYSGTPDDNGGYCVTVGSSGSALMFDRSQPCKASESVDLPIDTTAVTDGQHTLKVTVTDAAQNASVVYDGTITTLNAPVNAVAPTTSNHGEDTFVGNLLTAKSGAWSAAVGAGTITYAYQWQDCDAQGGGCQAIAGANASSYTATPSDVGHTLRVAVSAADNDGFATATSVPTAVVQAASGSLGAGPGPGVPPVSPPPPPPPPASVPNGSAASVTAQLKLGSPRVISRSFARRAFAVSGRLLNSQGQPITGAKLDVLAKVLDGGAPTVVVAHATTGAAGVFTARIPGGPSRLFTVAYRAFSNATDYAAQAQLQETVNAGVQLSVAPRRTSPNGRIVLSGRVLGDVPRTGVVVELLVHYLGRWEPFRTPRTDAAGRFRVVYQFQGGLGRFPFRAQIRDGQASFPYARGQSPVINVTTR